MIFKVSLRVSIPVLQPLGLEDNAIGMLRAVTQQDDCAPGQSPSQVLETGDATFGFDEFAAGCCSPTLKAVDL